MSEENQGAVIEPGTSVQTGAQEQTIGNQAGEQFINQESVNKAIGRQHAKFQEARLEADSLKQDKADLEKKLEGLQATSAPTIPPIPDQYDDDFEQKLRTRDEAIRQSVLHSSNQETLRLQRENNVKQTAQQAQDSQQKVVTGFDARTKELGLDSAEMNTAAGTVLSYGVTGDLANYILQDPDGPLILKHLAANPAQLDSLATMDPMSAAVRISTEIRPEAQKLKPRQSQTPNPAQIINGNGVPEQMSPLIAGATFE